MNFRNLQRFSCVPIDYMAQQFDITDKMRAILIDWLIEVYSKILFLETYWIYYIQRLIKILIECFRYMTSLS